jgi:hypothetical protein
MPGSLTFTFESEVLAELFIARLMLYLSLDGTREGHVVMVTPREERQVAEVERLARGSYASFNGSASPS